MATPTKQRKNGLKNKNFLKNSKYFYIFLLYYVQFDKWYGKNFIKGINTLYFIRIPVLKNILNFKILHKINFFVL